MLITGVALLQLFSTIGFDNTPLNMLIAHVLVTTPYVVRTVAASLLLADTDARRCGAHAGGRTLARLPPHHRAADRARSGGRVHCSRS